LIIEPVAVTRVERGETSSTLIPKMSAVNTTEPPTAIGAVSKATRSTVTVADDPDVEVRAEEKLSFVDVNRVRKQKLL